MNKPTVDELLTTSRPRSFSEDAQVRQQIADLVAKTHAADAAQQAPRRRRKLLIAIPVIGFGALALTAGALVVTTMTPAVTIPISYTTDTGRTVACNVGVGGGSILDPQATAIGDYLRSQDWSGIGQKVYDRAITTPYVPGPDADVDLAPEEIDNMSWTDAMAALIPGTMPANLTADWTYTGWSSDCTGDLH